MGSGLHIGIDCRLPTYQMGGISRYTIQLIQALAALAGNERYTIFHSRKESRTFTPADERFSRSDLWTPCQHSWERWALAAELAPHRLDVLHSPNFIPPSGGAGRKVITVHDLAFLRYPQFLTAASRRYYADQIAWAVRAADHIAADSESSRRDLIELLQAPSRKVTTIHLAAAPAFLAEYAEEEVERVTQEYGLVGGFILSVGTLEPRKNHETLLRVYERLRVERGFDVPLVLVGSKGWMYDDVFRIIAELKLGGSVRHLSAIPDEKLALLYRAAGVLAFPSHYEGFGLPALEAMHCGCPVVASDQGSLPEVVGNAGVLLPPDDVEAWTEALDKVLRDRAYAAELRQAGRAQARQFTWERTASATLALYRGN